MFKSIVRIRSMSRKSNIQYPHQTVIQGGGHCTGFCIEYKKKKYIMTCEHCIGTEIYLQSSFSSKIYPGKIIFSTQCLDIMLLESDICEELIPLKFEIKIPSMGEKITMQSYQSGDRGDLQFGRGFVRNLEIIDIAYMERLTLAVDMHIIPGDSGSPILNSKNMIVGIVSAGDDNDYGGFILANIYIENFFERLEHYNKTKELFYFTNLTITTRQLVNCKALRGYLGYDETFEDIGILVLHEHIRGAQVFKKNDILMKINNIPIDNEGNIPLHKIVDCSDTFFRIPFRILVSMLLPDSMIKLEVFRDKRVEKIEYKCKAFLPEYYISAEEVPNSSLFWAGGIFQPVSLELINQLSLDDYSLQRKTASFRNSVPPNVRLVILTSSFFHPSLDLHNLHNEFVKAVNDVIVDDIVHLKELLENNTSEYIVISFYSTYVELIFKMTTVKALNRDIYFSK